MSKRSRLEVRIGDDDEAAPRTEWWYAHARALMCRLWEEPTTIDDDDDANKGGRMHRMGMHALKLRSPVAG
jgi:hypothetical protein